MASFPDVGPMKNAPVTNVAAYPINPSQIHVWENPRSLYSTSERPISNTMSEAGMNRRVPQNAMSFANAASRV